MHQETRPPLEPGWWVIAPAAELGADRALTLTRFGRPMVLWRADGALRAAWDGCPHRGATFSGASVRGGQLLCPFHSFAFGPDGAATAVPCDGPSASTRGLQMRMLPAQEAHGLLWVWVAASAPQGALPWFEGLAAETWTDLTVEFEAPWDLVIETMLDFAHLPTVHARSIGANFPSAIQVRQELGPQGLTATVQGQPGGIAWAAPGSWRLDITDQVKNVGFFTPIDAGRTAVTYRFWQGYLRWPPLARAVGWLANFSNRRVANEDRAVIEGMARARAAFPQTDRLVAADAPIATFRRARRAWLRSGQLGAVPAPEEAGAAPSAEA
jgi:phenylpropionate dioxygenase-like ring-hydroxylating dioxygenase large terminal subunit